MAMDILVYISYMFILILAMRQILRAHNWSAYRCVSKVYICVPCEGLSLKEVVAKMLAGSDASEETVNSITADVIAYIIAVFFRYLGHALILTYGSLGLKIATISIIFMDVVIWVLPQHNKKQELCMGLASWILHMSAFVLS